MKICCIELTLLWCKAMEVDGFRRVSHRSLVKSQKLPYIPTQDGNLLAKVGTLKTQGWTCEFKIIYCRANVVLYNWLWIKYSWNYLLWSKPRRGQEKYSWSRADWRPIVSLHSEGADCVTIQGEVLPSLWQLILSISVSMRGLYGFCWVRTCVQFFRWFLTLRISTLSISDFCYFYFYFCCSSKDHKEKEVSEVVVVCELFQKTCTFLQSSI